MKKNFNMKVRVNGEQSDYPKQKKYDKLSASSFEKKNTGQHFTKYTPIKKQDHKPAWKQKQQSPVKKRILLASMSAVIIGSLLGLIMLNMFGTLEKEQGIEVNQLSKTNGSNKAPVEKKASDKQKKHIIPEMSAFVLQGGVFSEQANLDEMTAIFTQAGHEAVIWKRDQVTYLFVGLAHDEQTAKTLASEIKEKKIETYVKQWSTPEIERTLAHKDYEWIMAFQKLWQQTLPSLQNKAISDGEQWKKLYGKQVEGEEMKSFMEQTNPIIEKLATKPEEISDMHFLKLWLEYEKLVHAIKH